MNKKVIQKALDELNKENPKIDYVRGILETLLDTDTPAPVTFQPAPRVEIPLGNGPRAESAVNPMVQPL